MSNPQVLCNSGTLRLFDTSLVRHGNPNPNTDPTDPTDLTLTLLKVILSNPVFAV